jgi:alpha-tubulin suppressor-like RCC1 family protein
VQVGTDTHWASVASGETHSLAVKTDGTLWTWGWNGYGQLGDGTTTFRNAPVQVGTDTNWTSVAAGFWHSMALKTDGTLWTWGWNGYGQLGDASNAPQNTPQPIP